MADKFLVIDGSSLIQGVFCPAAADDTERCAYGCCVRFLQYAFAPFGGRAAQVAGGSV